jgi:hypothetical protein
MLPLYPFNSQETVTTLYSLNYCDKRKVTGENFVQLQITSDRVLLLTLIHRLTATYCDFSIYK